MSGGLLATGYLMAAVDIGSATATSTGTTLTSGAANTKGSYTQLVASSAKDTDYIIVGNDMGPSAGSNLSLDLAIGAGGSEVNILSDLFLSDVGTAFPYHIPISIPAGSRVSARIQSTAVSDTCKVNVVLCAGNPQYRGYNKSDTYGFTAATTLGTTVDPGGTANTKGAYSQITTATTRDHYGVMFALDRQGHAALAATLLVDLSIGAAASEIVIVPNMLWIAQSSGNPVPSVTPVIPFHIPSGSRVAIRAQSSANTVTTRLFGVTMYGFS